MWKHGIANPDGEDQLGHDVKNNDMTTATCEVMSILQPYPLNLHSQGHYKLCQESKLQTLVVPKSGHCKLL